MGGAGGQNQVGVAAEHVECARRAWIREGCRRVSARGYGNSPQSNMGRYQQYCSGRQALDWLLTEKRIGAYVGVDPTAPSLHVGHLLPLMALYWMYLHGYYTVSLVSDSRPSAGTAR